MTFYESGALKRVEFHEQKPAQTCQHRNRQELGTMGWERWRCKDCGFQYEKDLNS